MVPPGVFSDMEFLIKQQGENSVEVDIGFLPQMELVASGPSIPTIHNGADIRDIPLAVSKLLRREAKDSPT